MRNRKLQFWRNRQIIQKIRRSQKRPDKVLKKSILKDLTINKAKGITNAKHREEALLAELARTREEIGKLKEEQLAIGTLNAPVVRPTSITSHNVESGEDEIEAVPVLFVMFNPFLA